ncbi:MAG: ABC transporter permease subunit [Planctomycetota bacterium]
MAGVATSVRRFFAGRAWRKLMRNRLAVASMAVVGVYVFVAMLGFVGVVTVGSTSERVMADNTPGWLERKELDERAADAIWMFERIAARIELAEEAEEPAEARRVLDEIAMAERRVLVEPPEVLRGLLDEAEAKLDAMYAVFDEKDEALETIIGNELRIDRFRERDAERFAERIGEMEAEIVEAEASLPELQTRADAALAELDTELFRLMPMPTGFDGVVYRVKCVLGSDGQGASILMKAMFSTKIAFQIGLVVAIACVLIGTSLGAAAAFFQGWVDYAVMYVVSVLSSIPSLVLLGVLVYMFFGSELFDNPAENPGLALVPVYAAMGLTFWLGVCRVIRGEVMKIRELEYVQAATVMGFGRLYVLVKHVVPNTAHLMFINFALLFIGAIKSEVILSFLGLGVKGQPSWGRMISQGKDDVTNGFFWEVGTASLFMFGLVLAFNVLTDALQDAFDPRHVD